MTNPMVNSTSDLTLSASVADEASEALLHSLLREIEQAGSAPKLAQAVQNLADQKLVGGIGALIEALSYNNPGAAVAAVDGLVKLGKIAVAPLLEKLDGHNYSARAWAIRAIALIGDPRGLDTLLQALREDFALSVRRAAAKGIGALHWEEISVSERYDAQCQAFTTLRHGLHDEEWVVRYAVVVGLQLLAQAVATDHEDPDRRTAKTELLSSMGQELKSLIDQEPEVAVKARLTLAVDVLTSLTNGTSPD